MYSGAPAFIRKLLKLFKPLFKVERTGSCLGSQPRKHKQYKVYR